MGCKPVFRILCGSIKSLLCASLTSFRYRLRFFVHAKGVVQHDERKHNFLSPSGREVSLSCLDAVSIAQGTELVLTTGGFPDDQSALQEGRKVKQSLLFAGAKLRIGIDAGGDRASSFLGAVVKEQMLREHGVNIINNVHGLSVYSEDIPVKTFSVSGVGLVSPTSAEEFAQTIMGNSDVASKLDEKTMLALELYGASHYEHSDRARFLTLVLAAEALLEPQERELCSRAFVEKLIRSTKDSSLAVPEKDSLLGSLRWLRKESISRSLSRLAQRYVPEKSYNSMPAIKFALECYRVRSGLVHTGRYDASGVSLGVLAAQLNLFLSDVLVAKVTGEGT